MQSSETPDFRQPGAISGPQGVADGRPQWLWGLSRPIVPDTPSWVYLRQACGCRGSIPLSLRHLRARDGRGPALIARFDLAADGAGDVQAVQLIRLRPDGAGRADIKPAAIVIGPGGLGLPIVIAPPHGLPGLIISEDVEDALKLHEATGMGAWAAGGASRMPALADAVPGGLDFVTVVVDRAPVKLRYANAFVERLGDCGIEARIAFLDEFLS